MMWHMKLTSRQAYIPGWSICFVQVNDPHLAAQVAGDVINFPKMLPDEMSPNSPSAQLFGSNIVFANDHEWTRHRKIVAPAFRGTWPAEAFGDVTAILSGVIAAAHGSPVNVHDLTQRLTLDVLFSVGFNEQFGMNSHNRPSPSLVLTIFVIDSLRKPDQPMVQTYKNVMSKCLR